MPTTYAHYRFGCDVYNNLPEDLRDMISRHRELFDFGVHGPDLLFYNNPLVKNKINQLGYACHEKTGRVFFTDAAKAVRSASDYEAALTYCIGVLCHFSLDRECHPYVGVKEKDGVSHSAIEASFDRFLMERDHLNPLTHDVTQHLHPSELSALTIAEFYPPLTTEQILITEKSMKAVLKGLIAPPGPKRTAIEKGTAMIGRASIAELLIPVNGNPLCYDSDRILFGHYQDAVTLALIMIPELIGFIEDGSPLGTGFDHTFGEN